MDAENSGPRCEDLAPWERVVIAFLWRIRRKKSKKWRISFPFTEQGLNVKPKDADGMNE